MGNAIKPIRLLLIEDADLDALLIVNALERYKPDAICTRVATFKIGEDLLRSGTMDVLLLDLGLPDTEDCADTYRRIKKWTHRVPVIIMTGLEDHEFARKTIRAGVEDFVTKEIIANDPERLADIVDFAIERHALSREAEEQSQAKDVILNCFMGAYSVQEPADLP